MKKNILAFFLILSSFASFSQDEYYCYKIITADWNTFSKKWDFNEPKVVNLTLTIYSNIVTINDEAHSRYEAQSNKTQDNTNNYDRTSWNAIDEKGRSIIMQIIKYKESGDIVFMIIYDNFLLSYYINKSGLSPFNS